MEEQESKDPRTHRDTKRRILAFGILSGAFGVSLMYADIDLNFSSTFDAENEQSTMAPMDTSFTFELGSFDAGFNPDASNTNLWMNNWNPVPGAGSSSAGYTQEGFPSGVAPNTGASNQFSGSVTLASNSAPFGVGEQAYIWGYDDRGTSGTGEWILITNPSWDYPLVSPGIQFPGVDFQVSDAGTVAALGTVNPGYASSGDDPHMVSASVVLAPVPEPSTAVLMLGGIAVLMLRRRR